MKILTIAIPVYNTEEYIKRCLDSILIKDILNDIEIIAVNDGSKDHSLEILKEYQRKYPDTLIVIDKKNGGHGSTINEALKVSTGKYFKVLDSDDWFDTKNFIDFITILKTCDEDVIASTYTEEYIYSGLTLLYDYSWLKDNSTIVFDKIEGNEPIKFYFPMSSATYKLDLLKKCNLHLFENTFYVDMQYNIMPIPYIKTVKYLNKDIYRYFIGRPTQSMNQKNLCKNYLDHQKVLTFLVDYYTKFSNSISKVKKAYMQFMITSMLYTFFRIVCVQIKDKKLSYKVFKQFDNYLRNTNLELYKCSNIYSEIKYTRKLKYLNIFFINLYLRILYFAKKVRSK